jgi:hypothetical protein
MRTSLANQLATWLLYAAGTSMWALLSLSGRELNPYWFVFVTTAAGLNFAAVARAVRYPSGGRTPRK